MSPATIDRALKEMKAEGRSPRRRGVAGSALRRSVPIRTFDDWDDPMPGYVEADLVSHSGPVAKGSYVWTFTLTDIATGWTECAPLVFRDQAVVTAVLDRLRELMPFKLLGFDTDNDSVFSNEAVRDYCRDTGVEFTRARPYRKNDQAWVSRKTVPLSDATLDTAVSKEWGSGNTCRFIRIGSIVHKFLSAVLQAGRETSRRCAGV